MICSEDDALLMLRKWRDESTLLLVGFGVRGSGGTTIRGATISALDDGRIEFVGPSESRCIVFLAGVRYDFAHPQDMPHIKPDRPITILDTALSITSYGGTVATLVPLTDALERHEQNH